MDIAIEEYKCQVCGYDNKIEQKIIQQSYYQKFYKNESVNVLLNQIKNVLQNESIKPKTDIDFTMSATITLDLDSQTDLCYFTEYIKTKLKNPITKEGLIYTPDAISITRCANNLCASTDVKIRIILHKNEEAHTVKENEQLQNHVQLTKRSYICESCGTVNSIDVLENCHSCKHCGKKYSSESPFAKADERTQIDYLAKESIRRLEQEIERNINYKDLSRDLYVNISLPIELNYSKKEAIIEGIRKALINDGRFTNIDLNGAYSTSITITCYVTEVERKREQKMIDRANSSCFDGCVYVLIGLLFLFALIMIVVSTQVGNGFSGFCLTIAVISGIVGLGLLGFARGWLH